MPVSEQHFMAPFVHDRSPAERPRDRLARFLSPYTPQTLAREIGTTKKAAQNILAGHWPGDLTFAGIVQRFGQDVLDAVFAPEISPVLARLKEEERALNAALEATRGRLRQMDGGVAGARQSLAASRPHRASAG